jgi:hypothetical protein
MTYRQLTEDNMTTNNIRLQAERLVWDQILNRAAEMMALPMDEAVREAAKLVAAEEAMKLDPQRLRQRKAEHRIWKRVIEYAYDHASAHGSSVADAIPAAVEIVRAEQQITQDIAIITKVTEAVAQTTLAAAKVAGAVAKKLGPRRTAPIYDAAGEIVGVKDLD